MPRMPQLRDPYSRATFEYVDQGASLPAHSAWVGVFRDAIATFEKHALSDASVPQDERQAAAKGFGQAFGRMLDTLEADPRAAIPGYEGQRMDCFVLCRIRERCLLNAGFDDIFRAVKAKENDAALSHLPGLLAELDACASARARWEQVLRGVFAGNIFDLGAANSAALYENNGAAGSFASTRDTLLARPWAIDDLARMLDRLAPPTTTNADNTATTNDAAGPAPGGGPAGGAHAATTLDAHAATARGDPRRHRPYAKAVLFVDNAGSDVVLGMLPLARELLRAGAEVVLAANAAPSCNDVTVPELECVLRIAALLDATLAECVASGALRVVASHSERLPVIDLAALSDGAASECECADLVVLEGMGRAIESNLYARFSGADVWKLGMIKHRPVAESLGGRLYDCVCRYDAAADERAV